MGDENIPEAPSPLSKDKLKKFEVEWRPRQEWTVLPSSMGGGPKGLGDPDDTSLRKVEKDVLIPMVMRDRAWMEKCVPEVKDFENCARKSGMMVTIACRHQNRRMQDCLIAWFKDDNFIQECTDMYLKKRKEYRETGVGQPLRRKEMKF